MRGRGRLLESYNGREGVFGRLWEGSATCCIGCRGCVMVLEGGKV